MDLPDDLSRQAERGPSLAFLWLRGKHYNRRGVQHAGRGVNPHRIDIADRPAIVAAKSRLGDWEGDIIATGCSPTAPITCWPAAARSGSCFEPTYALPPPTCSRKSSSNSGRTDGKAGHASSSRAGKSNPNGNGPGRLRNSLR
jgi:hypothetical protein